MRLFGFDVTRHKQLTSPIGNRGGWLPIIRESFAGAFQTNVEVDNNTALTYFAVFACMTLIASDIAKLRVRLVQRDNDDIWNEATNPAFSPVLRKPNPIQTRIQFWENWTLSKLSNGNVYVLKVRDRRGVVNRLYVLDPHRVQTLVAESGDVFYKLNTDNISGLRDEVTVPASEIIHDRMNTLFHPLIGMSPITAAGLSAMQGFNIQQNSALFFQNRSMPSGILTAPGAIKDETAQRLKEHWEANYKGVNFGKIAVLGDGLKFEPMAVTAHDAQLIEQLKWTAEVVCSVFHVPPYKIGIGQPPAYNNVQALNIEYYSQAIQVLIESAELVLDEGLSLPERLSVSFDLDGLLRMDTQTKVNALKEAVGAGINSPNEARKRLGYGPVKGGQTPYLQQQNYSLSALDERDKANPLAGPQLSPDDDRDDDDSEMEEEERAFVARSALAKELGLYVTARL